MDAKTKKTWISVIVAILIICVMIGVALIGTAVYVFRRHIDTQFVSAQIAANEFQQARNRFSGQQPLIELVHGEDDRPILHRRAGHATGELQSLRVLAFDPRAGKLVRVSLPFWLLRLAPHHNFTIRADTFELEGDRMNFTFEDVERAGPGLLLDARNPHDGTLVLVWTE
jgi:type II secretory pathway pseudopilin PulG